MVSDTLKIAPVASAFRKPLAAVNKASQQNGEQACYPVGRYFMGSHLVDRHLTAKAPPTIQIMTDLIRMLLLRVRR